MVEDVDHEKITLSNGMTLSVSKEICEEDDKLVTERLYNIWGSSSGVGSDFFNIYRMERSNEIKRLKEMDRKWNEDIEHKFFQTKRLIRMKQEEEKRQKRKQKRDQKKQRAKERKLNEVKIKGIKHGTINSESDPDEEEEFNLSQSSNTSGRTVLKKDYEENAVGQDDVTHTDRSYFNSKDLHDDQSTAIKLKVTLKTDSDDHESEVNDTKIFTNLIENVSPDGEENIQSSLMQPSKPSKVNPSSKSDLSNIHQPPIKTRDLSGNIIIQELNDDGF